MTLAAILLFCLLPVSRATGSPPGVQGFAAQDQSGGAAAQPRSQPAQTTSPAPAAPVAAQPQSKASPAKPHAEPATHHKKAAVPDCAKSAGSGPAGSHPAAAGVTNGASPLKPCPPARKVIRNGGSDEPVVELKGSTSAEQASYERFSTEQLTTATEENLKKVAGRELKAGAAETVSQIKQFMEQAKSAVTAGDLVRGRNLALKARLLSDELVKP